MSLDLAGLADKIKFLDYVVMRKWESLPIVEKDEDVDFFVTVQDYKELDRIVGEYLPDHKYDIRTPRDHYFGTRVNHLMLRNRNKYKGFWIPNPHAHFISLYFHNLVHKGDHRYDKELEQIFWDWSQPREPDDKGVGFHALS